MDWIKYKVDETEIPQMYNVTQLRKKSVPEIIETDTGNMLLGFLTPLLAWI